MRQDNPIVFSCRHSFINVFPLACTSIEITWLMRSIPVLGPSNLVTLPKEWHTGAKYRKFLNTIYENVSIVRLQCLESEKTIYGRFSFAGVF